MEEDVFVVRTWIERTCQAFDEYLYAVVFKIEYAKVRTSFETYRIVKLLSVLCEIMVAQSA